MRTLLTLVVVCGVALVVACSSFGSDDPEQPSPSSSSTSSTSSSGGTPGIDGSTASDIDAGLDGSSSLGCDPNVVLAGNAVAPDTSHEIDEEAADVYPFVPTTDGKANCIHFFIHSVAGPTDAEVGVYGLSSTRPGSLLGKGRLKSVTTGWMSAKLEPPVTVTQGSSLYLAILPLTKSIHVRAKETGCLGVEKEYSQFNVTTLPAIFSQGAEQGDACNTGTFLSP